MTSTDQWTPTSMPKIRPIRTLGFMRGSLARVHARTRSPVQRYDPGRDVPKAAAKSAGIAARHRA